MWKPFSDKSVKFKLVVMFTIAGALPMLGSMAIIHRQTTQHLIQSTEQRLVDKARGTETALREHLDQLAIDARYIADIDSVRDFLRQHAAERSVDDGTFEAAGREIAYFQKLHAGDAHHIFLADAAGTVVLNAPYSGWGATGGVSADVMRRTQGPHFQKSLAHLPEYEQALEDTVFTDSFHFPEGDHHQQLILTPVTDENGGTIGIVALEVNLANIDRNMIAPFQFERTGTMQLRDHDGRRVVYLLEDEANPAPLPEGLAEAIDTQEAVIGWFDSAQREVLGVYLPLPQGSWVLSAEIDRDEVMAPVRAQQRQFLMLLLVSVCVLAGVVNLIGGQFWRPLRAIVEATGRVADGDLWHNIAVDRRDELGQLQDAVEHMRRSMKLQIDHLDAQVTERTVELEYANELLQRDARMDKLTGLANREAMIDALQEQLDQFQNDPSHLVAVLFFDFDRFKVVNDSLGHAAGDALLCSIADRFRDELREVDLAARFGGDEFVVMLGPVDHPTQAHAAADRLLRLFEQAHDIQGHRITSTASIGLVIAHERYTRAYEMIRDADAAMYGAKLAGKGQIVCFDEQMLETAQRRLRIEEDLRDAVGAGQLRTYFQPIIALEDMTLVGFEALVRWLHPKLGLVRPDQFIPIAEDTGQIVEIGQWILRDTLEHLVRWDAMDHGHGRLSVNVNVAKRQLIHPDFVQNIHEELERADIEPHRLKIEITESTAIDPRSDMTDVIRRVRETGVQIAMDDFGTGHSSLGLLHQFELDVLKIDKSFIWGMEQSREMAAVLHAIIALAQNTGMQVVAEGVETETQVAYLISHGCDMVQGYYFAQPLNEQEANDFLKRPRIFRSAA